MAFEEIISKGGMDVGMEGERGLVAGRSQREKRRSYKDLLREEEEIAAQDSELFMLGGDVHKKKKKASDDFYYRDHEGGSGPPSHKKKHKSSSLFHGGGGGKEAPLALREADGLKMKLMMSPERDNKGPSRKEKDRERGGGGGAFGKTAKKKAAQNREPLPIVGKEVEVEGHYSGGLGDDSSSSGAELEAGELVIDDSTYTHAKKKSKKSKKSKKKKEKEKDRDKEKSSKERKHSKASAVGPMYAMSAAPPPPHPHRPNPPHPHPHHPAANEAPPPPPPEKKNKKKEGKEKDKHNKDKDKPKKKNTTAYQVFCKEYRVNINAEQPGLVFGELSKRLAEVWKAMPEKDKLVWRQKAQYIQHKQNKAEATTVKRNAPIDVKSKGAMKGVGAAAGMGSPSKGSAGLSLSPARIPDVDPIDAAAHLQLLGESLSLIGHRLQETEGMVAVSGSLSVLLDSILCALGPLTCLTAQIPQLNGCPRSVLSNTLDNVAYIMPGL
ncbi:hypothetical protein CRUP_011669 [Coryphaenoides rupestris]|nr:hypothetical protein CRUP_011669 [Coryphaenoides rupestris]